LVGGLRLGPKNVFLQMGRYRESIEICDVGWNTSSDHNCLLLKIDCLQHLGDLDKAILEAQNLMRLRPDLVNPRDIEVLMKLKAEISVKDYYKILGVPRNATLKQINSKFRQMSLIYHPGNYNLFLLWFSMVAGRKKSLWQATG